MGMMMHSHRLHPLRLIKHTKPLFVIQLGNIRWDTTANLLLVALKEQDLVAKFSEKQTAGFDHYFTIPRYSLRSGQSLFT